jgi:hypothetical protein
MSASIVHSLYLRYVQNREVLYNSPVASVRFQRHVTLRLLEIIVLGG